MLSTLFLLSSALMALGQPLIVSLDLLKIVNSGNTEGRCAVLACIYYSSVYDDFYRAWEVQYNKDGSVKSRQALTATGGETDRIQIFNQPTWIASMVAHNEVFGPDPGLENAGKNVKTARTPWTDDGLTIDVMEVTWDC